MRKISINFDKRKIEKFCKKYHTVFSFAGIESEIIGRQVDLKTSNDLSPLNALCIVRQTSRRENEH
jgi:hypothetical protein